MCDVFDTSDNVDNYHNINYHPESGYRTGDIFDFHPAYRVSAFYTCMIFVKWKLVCNAFDTPDHAAKITINP